MMKYFSFIAILSISILLNAILLFFLSTQILSNDGRNLVELSSGLIYLACEYNLNFSHVFHITKNDTLPILNNYLWLSKNHITKETSSKLSAFTPLNNWNDNLLSAMSGIDSLNASTIKNIRLDSFKTIIYDPYYPHIKSSLLKGMTLEDLVDIVIPLQHSSFDFLDIWKSFLRSFHFIFIIKTIEISLIIPSWLSYELYTMEDIKYVLGRDHWIITSGDISSMRSFGFLVSDKDYIFTMDQDCLPSTSSCISSSFSSTSTSPTKTMHIIAQHLYNLLTPATPQYFNTHYDPFIVDADFTRGYPYSLRGGVTTVVSHGLFGNAYDYDALTNLMRHQPKKDIPYIPTVITIPFGTLYSMSTKNIAFNRKLIGLALFQIPLGETSPWGHYADIFSGWIAKVIADHLQYGTKNGMPYMDISSKYSTVTSITTENLSTQLNDNINYESKLYAAKLKEEYMGLFWQEDFFDFFDNIKLNKTHSNVITAFEELTNHMVLKLSHLHPYFTTIFQAMRIWIKVWKSRHAADTCTHSSQAIECIPQILPKSSNSSFHPATSTSTCAIFTVINNEPYYLPLWIRYYSRQVDVRDLWILDHNTNDNSTHPSKLPKGINYRKLRGETAWSPHHFLNRQVELHAQRLLRYGYKCYLFVEVDEIIIPDPVMYPGGLQQYFKYFITGSFNVTRTHGQSLLHASLSSNKEKDIDWTEPILAQRDYWAHDEFYSKPLLSKVPLRFTPGFHNAATTTTISITKDYNLILLHLHNIDQTYCVTREFTKYNAARAHFKADEVDLGVIAASTKKSWKELIHTGRVCGQTFFNPNLPKKSLPGFLKNFEQIPMKWKQVII